MAGEKKAAAPPAAVPKRRAFTRLRQALAGRTALVLALAALAAGAAGAYAAWRKVRGTVLAGDEYRLGAHDMEITPPPKWIRSDVKSEVIRYGGLGANLSILDERLTVRVAQAFSLHAWVERVERVYKQHPARVVVELVYREPVAAVEVEDGILFVDAKGVLLPTEDFTAADAERYPRIRGVRSSPLRPVGSSWGDPEVLAAAQIAAALRHDWGKLKFYRLAAADNELARPGEARFEIVTHRGTKVLWGRSPAAATSGEMSAGEKLARLLELSARFGTLDDVPRSGQPIDLRAESDRVAAPATTVRPLPNTDEAQPAVKVSPAAAESSP